MVCCVLCISFPPGVYVGIFNLIASIPGPSILTLHIRVLVFVLCGGPKTFPRTYINALIFSILQGLLLHYYVSYLARWLSCWERASPSALRVCCRKNVLLCFMYFLSHLVSMLGRYLKFNCIDSWSLYFCSNNI